MTFSIYPPSFLCFIPLYTLLYRFFILEDMKDFLHLLRRLFAGVAKIFHVLRIEKSIFSIIYYIRSLKHKKRNTSGRNYEVFLNFHVSCLICQEDILYCFSLSYLSDMLLYKLTLTYSLKILNRLSAS